VQKTAKVSFYEATLSNASRETYPFNSSFWYKVAIMRTQKRKQKKRRISVGAPLSPENLSYAQFEGGKIR
jgi:hypothetical protein